MSVPALALALPQLLPHSVVVHFPVAFWLGAFAFALLAALRSGSNSPAAADSAGRGEALHRTSVHMLLAGTICAAVALFTGFSAAETLPAATGAGAASTEVLLESHRTLMIFSFAVALLLSVAALALGSRLAGKKRAIFLAGLTLLAVLVLFGAARGGALAGHFS